MLILPGKFAISFSKLYPMYSSKMILSCFLLLLFSGISGQTPDLGWANKTGSHSFKQPETIFHANEYGAVNDGKTLSSPFIQKAIDACAAKGGGIVVLDPGTYVCGSIFLKDKVQLRINKGVLILGSENFKDYPEINTRIAGIEMKWPAALINLIDSKEASVTGEGTINARGKFCWDKYWAMRKDYEAKNLRWIVDYDAKRVRTCLVQNATDVRITGLTFKNAGFWTVQVLYSKYVTVDGVIIRNNEEGHGPSTDGIDIDSSSWILVQNCDIDCNDDNFCLKSGRDWDGLRVNRPTEYVVIRKCLARRGGGLLTLGSETSGGIRHVLATGLTASHTDNGLRIKSATTRGGTIEDIYFQNCTLDSVNVVFNYTLNWYPAYSYAELPKGYSYDSVPDYWKTILQKVIPAEKGIPHAKDLYVSNLKVTHANTVFAAHGLETSPLSHFVYTQSKISADKMGVMEYTADWIFQDLHLNLDKEKASIKAGSKEEKERLKD